MRYYPDALYEQLMEVRHRPELLLGRCDIHLLQCFLNGYSFAAENTVTDSMATCWLDAFTTYVNTKYNPQQHSYNLASIILSRGCTAENGIELFYCMLDDFSKKYMSLEVGSQPLSKPDQEIQFVRLGLTAVGDLLKLGTLGVMDSPDICTELVWSNDCRTVTVLKYPATVGTEDIQLFLETIEKSSPPVCDQICGTHIPFHTVQI